MRIVINITELPGLFTIRYEANAPGAEDTPRVLKVRNLLMKTIERAAQTALDATKPRVAKKRRPK